MYYKKKKKKSNKTSIPLSQSCSLAIGYKRGVPFSKGLSQYTANSTALWDIKKYGQKKRELKEKKKKKKKNKQNLDRQFHPIILQLSSQIQSTLQKQL